MKNWDEIRTAYAVAKLGTVSAAAESLGMQRATVIRHIDQLESELGTKLFQRHGRGYTPTEMGNDLLQVAGTAEAEFEQLKARAKGCNELYGEFVVTSLPFIAPFLLPALGVLRQQNPTLDIHYVSSPDLFKLEYGQAHIAIRTGEKPDHPDYVVKPFVTLKLGLFAHRDYVEKHGKPQRSEDFTQHQFIVVSDRSGFSKTVINRWLAARVTAENIALQTNDDSVREQAIKASLGIGVMLAHKAADSPDLVEVYPTNPDWTEPNWLTTHGDLHRSEKVQRFLQLLTDVAYATPTNTTTPLPPAPLNE